MNQLEILIDDLYDRSLIYIDICSSCSYYYNRSKYMFSLPIILISSLLSILNSNMLENDMKLINIILNVIIALLVSLSSLFKLGEKQQCFKSNAIKFTELNHNLQMAITLKEKITKEYIKNIIEKYDGIIGGIEFEIPNHIKTRIHNKYKTKRTLPLIINGVEKDPEYRKPIGILNSPGNSIDF